MSRLHQFLVVVLLACWLPATTHCAMEAANMVPPTCCENPAAPADDSDDEHGAPHCSEWENRLSAAQETIAAKEPVLTCCEFLLALTCVPEPDSVALTTRHEENSPPVWRTTWHFARRTALPVRAPARV